MDRRTYYSDINVLFEIIHQLRFRELMFLPKTGAPIRWLNAQYVNMLKRHMTQYKFLDRDMNMYFSLAHYKDFPTFSYSWREKSAQQKVWLTSFQHHIKGYDLFIETDSDDLGESIGDGIKIKRVFDDYGLKYSIKFSGSKGVHLIVPYDEFTHIKNVTLFSTGEYCLVDVFKDLAVAIREVFDVPTLDTSVQDIKRVCKIGYSWDVKSGLISLPMTDDMLYTFNLDDYEPANVIKSVRKRGLLWRNTDIPKTTRQKNVSRLLSDMEII